MVSYKKTCTRAKQNLIYCIASAISNYLNYSQISQNASIDPLPKEKRSFGRQLNNKLRIFSLEFHVDIFFFIAYCPSFCIVS